MLDVHYIASDKIESIVQDIASYINDQLAMGESVLWLLSGGSAITTAVKARELIQLTDTSPPLHIGLIDERYGPVGHSDSNWQKLLDAGFDFTHTTKHPILIDGLSRNEATAAYNQVLTELLQSCRSIGLFGMGSDGHTSGLLPRNQVMHTKDLVAEYIGPDYERITTTPALIPKLQRSILFVCGAEKHAAVQAFLDLDNEDDEEDMPALILKKALALSVYTDYKGHY